MQAGSGGIGVAIQGLLKEYLILKSDNNTYTCSDLDVNVPGTNCSGPAIKNTAATTQLPTTSCSSRLAALKNVVCPMTPLTDKYGRFVPCNKIADCFPYWTLSNNLTGLFSYTGPKVVPAAYQAPTVICVQFSKPANDIQGNKCTTSSRDLNSEVRQTYNGGYCVGTDMKACAATENSG